MEQIPESKRPYSSPALTLMTEEQATRFVAQRAALTKEAAANFLQSLRLEFEAKSKKHSAYGNSNGNRGRLA